MPVRCIPIEYNSCAFEKFELFLNLSEAAGCFCVAKIGEELI